MEFKDLNLKPFILETLKEINFIHPTPIQESVYASLKKQKNIIASSATGSGKTHAFLIPILNKIDLSGNFVQAVILSPTRELASQIYINTLKFTEKVGIDVKLFVGGSSRETEIKKLGNNQPQVVIGTIGRIYDLAVKENVLKIYTASDFVIDEADMIFDEKSLIEVDKLLSVLTLDPRFWIFSATLSVEVKKFIHKYLGDTEEVIIPESNLTKKNIEHLFIPCKAKAKEDILKQIMEVINPYLAIIFTNSKEDAVELSKHLAGIGIKVGLIHGDLDSRDRKQTLKRIHDGKYQYVVATDIASRGIDIEGVSHVINFDLPKDVEFYIHRAGRTARFEQTGYAITLYSYDDETYVNYLKQKGLIINYYKIVNKEFVPTKIEFIKKRNSKQEQIEAIHKKYPKPTKIKPGYKKKRMEKINKEIKQMERARIEEIYRKKRHENR